MASSWKVLVTTRAVIDTGDAALQLLRDSGCEIVPAPELGPHSPKALIPLLDGADAVLADLDQYTAEVLRSPSARQLKIISRWGVGYDAIDIAAATQAGVVVAFTPGLLDETVADFAFALILGAARQIHHGHMIMRDGDWRKSWASDVHHKTLGIIGCGRIGQAVARRAAGFNMRVIGFDPFPRPSASLEYLPLEEVLQQSDFVSLHAAAKPENRHLINAERLRLLKPSAFLINTARGTLIDEAALIETLQDGRIAGAALDVFTVEPLPKEHPLRNTPRLLLTPHQASYTVEAGNTVSWAAAKAIVDLKNGLRPEAVVNPDVFQSSALRRPLSS